MFWYRRERPLRLNNPLYPRWVGEVDTPGSALAVAAQDNHLYVADEQAGVQVFDIVDPADPTLVHTRDTAKLTLVR
jgi:hypothetical protein